MADFLRSYPTHEKADQIQKWADQYDFDTRDRQMHNRRKKLKAEGPDEQLARDALDDEDLGRLADAAKRWKELSQRKGNANLDLHVWGLVGERYGQALQKIEERYAELRKTAATDATSADTFEQSALATVRIELEAEKAKLPEQAEKHLLQAMNRWDDLRASAEANSDHRLWQLLALKRLREIREGKK